MLQFLLARLLIMRPRFVDQASDVADSACDRHGDVSAERLTADRNYQEGGGHQRDCGHLLVSFIAAIVTQVHLVEPPRLCSAFLVNRAESRHQERTATLGTFLYKTHRLLTASSL